MTDFNEKPKMVVTGAEFLEILAPVEWGHAENIARIVIPTSFQGEYFKDPSGTPEYVIKKDVTPAEIVRLVQEET